MMGHSRDLKCWSAFVPKRYKSTSLSCSFKNDSAYLMMLVLNPPQRPRSPVMIITASRFAVLDSKNGEILSPSFCAVVKDKILKVFHEMMAKEVSLHVGKELIPTYLYGRIYKKGADVYRHTDRPECEYSVSLTLDSSEEDKSWPIFFKAKDDKEYKVEMNAGDAVIYKGQEVEHWRNEKLEKDWQTQLFLHFVDAKGENANTAVTERMRILDEDNRLSNSISLDGEDYQKVGTGNYQFLNPKNIEDAKKKKLIAQGFDEKNAEYVLRGPSTWNYQGKEGIDNEICEYYKKKYESLELYPALIGGDRIDNEEDSYVDPTIRNQYLVC